MTFHDVPKGYRLLLPGELMDYRGILGSFRGVPAGFRGVLVNILLRLLVMPVHPNKN